MIDDLDIDDLVSDLRSSETRQNPTSQAPQLSGEELEKYILEVSSRILNNGLDTLAVMQTEVHANRDAETVESYAALLKSVMSAAETINKMHIAKEKNKNAKELKQMDIDSKEKIANNQITADNNRLTGGNTNILVATREDFFKALTADEQEFVESIETEPVDPS